MQHKLTEGKLLDTKGHLNEAGYHTRLIKEYRRTDIKNHKWKIKEWDYYIVTNGRYAVALTVADNSYMSLLSASFLDFEKPSYKTTSVMKFFTFGKLKLPSTAEEGDVHYADKRVRFSFVKRDDKRVLKCDFARFDNKLPLSCELTLTQFPQDYMVIATPFKKKHAFYYNTKINCMTAEGFVTVNGKRYEFDKSDSLGTLDWGRGIWTYKNTWYWASLQTRLDDGRTFGFNLGYGFGDTSKASENMLFVDGIAHKLNQVTFNIPKDKHGKDDYMSPWTFTSDDDRLYLDFVPIIDRKDITDIGIIASRQHQVFGKFSGRFTLDDGDVLYITDKLGFAEKVFNKW
ncbi:MAG: DUF2804 domain-containing protein [Corallococcus sp.]|nr:DUF2804 domain-containing protein [Corallococcus sp.]